MSTPEKHARWTAHLRSADPSAAYRQEDKRVRLAIGGDARRSDMTTKRLAELDERDH